MGNKKMRRNILILTLFIIFGLSLTINISPLKRILSKHKAVKRRARDVEADTDAEVEDSTDVAADVLEGGEEEDGDEEGGEGGEQQEGGEEEGELGEERRVKRFAREEEEHGDEEGGEGGEQQEGGEGGEQQEGGEEEELGEERRVKRFAREEEEHGDEEGGEGG